MDKQVRCNECFRVIRAHVEGEAIFERCPECVVKYG